MTTISNGESGLSVRNKLNDIWAGLDLNAYDTSIAATAVDVFVYDTSKDSDGGAWRKRTQHTSWYNETLNTATRGSRREFPAVAVIVAEATKVTIYDGDDPALPMWMVFNTGSGDILRNQTVSSVSMSVGALSVGGSNQIQTVNFVADKATWFASNSTYGGDYTPLSERNSGVTQYLIGTGSGLPTIVNSTVNDVAMTVLPDAPIDPATGLPVPTIAVATAGGVSVIKDDGTVVDATFVGNRNYVSTVDFSADNWVFATTSNVTNPAAWFPVLFEIPSADVANVGTTTGGNGVGFTFLDAPYINTTQYEAGTDAVASDQNLFLGKTVGFWKIPAVPDDTLAVMRKNMVSKITSTYNTGWMNGDIKGAFLADTDDTDLVGANVYTSDFSVGVDGFLSNNSTISADTGRLKIVDAGPNGVAYKSFSVTAGKPYVVSFRYEYPSANVTNDYAISVRAGTFTGTILAQKTTGFVEDAPTEAVLYVTPTTNTIVLVLAPSSNTGDIAFYDNISIDLADADRSVNNKGLIVNGTVTRSPVATGAELVGYSGFSASNYLEQPYNADLDFGTGDFCVMGWVKPASVDADYIFDCRDQTVTPTGFFLYINGSGQPTLYTQSVGSSTLATSSQALSVGSWQYVVGVRRSGINYIYVNGVLTGTASGATQNVNHTNRKLFVGNSIGLFSYHALQSSLALLRISATAPTAEQIKKIYEDEKVLFQENAACTLYGASDAVTALAHDPVTDLLHVGTSAGRSVFQGLRRVSNTTTAVGTAISASNSLVVEE